MANASVQIAAVVADTAGGADTQSVTVNVQVAVAAAPADEPQPLQEPDDPNRQTLYGRGIVQQSPQAPSFLFSCYCLVVCYILLLGSPQSHKIIIHPHFLGIAE